MNREVVPILDDPIVFTTGLLGGGVGEPIVQGILRGLNDAEAQVQTWVNASRIRGQFWGV